MSGFEDHQDRLKSHLHGIPPVGPAKNVSEAMADAEAAQVLKQQGGGSLQAGNLGWLLRLWDKGPVGRGLFLLVLQVPLIILASSLPGILSLLAIFASTVMLIVSFAMIAYGGIRRLFNGRRKP